MAAQPTKFLDLDAIEHEATVVVIKLAGVEHKLTPISVTDWITNTKVMQTLAADASDIEVQVDAMIGMITRQFKTLTKDMLREMPLTKLNAILEFARANNGENAANKEAAAEAKANPPTAVTSAP